MSIFVGNSEIKNVYIGTTPVKEVYVGTTKIRPTYRTFTISWTEKSNMSSGWTYSDDAAGLTAGSTAFDEFFGYSGVRLSTAGVETAEVTQAQSGGAGKLNITSLGTLTSGDNVMIKFPVRGIKMSKSGSVVTLSITEELGKSGYQYYAFQNTGDIESNTESTATKPLYLGTYKGTINSSNVIKSWSGATVKGGNYVGNANLLPYAKANGTGWDMMGFYQGELIWAYYMMKYGSPYGKDTVGEGYTASNGATTGGTNSQTNATYGTSSTSTQMKLFGIEDWWGNYGTFLGGAIIDGSRNIYTALHDFSASTSSHYKVAGTLFSGSNYYITSIIGTNKAMFAPSATTSSVTYYKGFATNTPSGGAGLLPANQQCPSLLWVSLSSGWTANAARLMYL